MGSSCRACSNNQLLRMADLGKQPIAHRFLSGPQEAEEKFPFVLDYCPVCGLVQICDPINPKLLYLDYNYCFSSQKPEIHIDDQVKTIIEQAAPGSVFEVGSNDGKFLKLLKEKGVLQVTGIEPNPFASQIARDRGLSVYTEMLSEELAQSLVREKGKFDLVVVRSVLEHLLDLKQFFRCVDTLLAESGFLFIDVPDVRSGIAMGDCSVFWEEHVSYFSENSLLGLLTNFQFKPVSIKKYNFSGGFVSILAKADPAVAVDLSKDSQLGGSISEFEQKMQSYGDFLRQTLDKCRRQGYAVVVYGVGCRAVTVINVLGLGDYIDFAIDDEPERQNKYMPGSRLIIRPPQSLGSSKQPIACLLAVNQENEEKVKARLKDIVRGKVEFVSLLSPSDIRGEVKNLNNHLLSYESK